MMPTFNCKHFPKVRVGQFDAGQVQHCEGNPIRLWLETAYYGSGHHLAVALLRGLNIYVKKNVCAAAGGRRRNTRFSPFYAEGENKKKRSTFFLIRGR